MGTQDFVESGLALIRHKDILRRKIKDIVIKKEGVFDILYVDKTVILTISKELKTIPGGITIIENTKKNRDCLASKWSDYVQNESTIIFLDDSTGANWSITPYIHEKIKGDKTIKDDLTVLASNV